MPDRLSVLSVFRRACGGCVALILIATAWTIPSAFASSSDMTNKHELRVIAYNLLLGDFWPKDAPMVVKAREQGQLAERLALDLALYEPGIVTSPRRRTKRL